MAVSSAHALRGLLPDFYFVNASVAQMEHHHALLQRLPHERRLIEFLRRPASFLTEISLCAYDDARPGMLAKISGTLAALGVNVQTASVFTVANAQQPDAPIILDTLMLSESYHGHDRKLRPKRDDEIRQALIQVIDGQVTIPQLLKIAPRRLRWPLRIHEITAEEAPIAGQIALSVRVSRHSMAIFRIAAAIAFLGFNTQTAQIHRGKDGVHGLFFVTGQASQMNEIVQQLRVALQTNAAPCNLANS